MKGLYLYTKSEDRINGPIQKPMTEGEIRELYVDNKRLAVVRAVPSDVITCSGCYLKALKRPNKGCMIPTAYVNGAALGGFCCGSAKIIIKEIDEILENL